MAIKEIPGFNELIELNLEQIDAYISKHSASVVTSLAQSVLRDIHIVRDRKAALSNFISKLEALEKKFDKNEVQELNKVKQKLQQLTTSRGRVSTLVQNFETIATVTPKQKPSSPPENLFIPIRKDIRSLNLDSKTLKVDINNIQKKIYSIESQPLSNGKLEAFVSALNLLLPSHENYHFSLFEEKIYQFLAARYPHTFKEDFQEGEKKEFIKTIADRYRQSLLQILKKENSSVLNWVDTVIEFIEDAESTLVRQRMEYLFVNSSKDIKYYIGSFFINYLNILLRSIKNICVPSALSYFKAEWEDLKKKEPYLGGSLLEVLKHYPTYNPSMYIPEFLDAVIIKYLTVLKIEELGDLTEKELEQRLRQTEKEISNIHLKRLFEKFYQINCLKQHLWFFDNLDKFKVFYNQNNDIDNNQNKGTCLQNAMERLAILIDSPNTESKEIQMGSTPKGRKVCAEITQAFSRMTKEQADKVQMDSAEKFGIKSTHLIEIPNTDDYASLMQELKNRYKASKSNFQCILILRDATGSHTFNIQINNQSKIIRFIDDNVGICEFSNLKDFDKQLVGYLQAFYPEYKHFAVGIYEKI